MKRLFPPAAALLLLAAPCAGGTAVPVRDEPPPLEAGAEVRTDALAAAEWIRGSAPGRWEPGKVYFLDCWATWCGPCLAAIPHLNDLHRKLEPDGLRVIGLSIWEDDAAKVRAFAGRAGDGMAFPVVFAGRSGPFITEWVAAAGVLSIPHVFVVKDGRLLLSADPALLDEAVARGLLAGGAAEERAIASVRAAEAAQGRLAEALKEFRAASAARQTAKMDAALAAVEKSDPAGHHAPGLRLEAALVKNDWARAGQLLPALPAGPAFSEVLVAAARRVGDAPDAPDSLRLAVRDSLAAAANSPAAFMTLARLRWITGEKAGAVEAARHGAAIASATERGPVAPYGKFAEALAAGILPDESEVRSWFREDLRRPTPVSAPAEPG